MNDEFQKCSEDNVAEILCVSAVSATDDSPGSGRVAAAALGNATDKTTFFVIRPRERRMTKKASDRGKAKF